MIQRADTDLLNVRFIICNDIKGEFIIYSVIKIIVFLAQAVVSLVKPLVICFQIASMSVHEVSTKVKK